MCTVHSTYLDRHTYNKIVRTYLFNIRAILIYLEDNSVLMFLYINCMYLWYVNIYGYVVYECGICIVNEWYMYGICMVYVCLYVCL